MRRRHALGLLAAAALGRARAATAPLRVALPPFLPASTMLATFRPLREHLARTLQRPVEMYTARDLDTHVRSLRLDPLDVSLVPPHVARLAARDWGFAVVAATLQSTAVLIVVHRDSTLRDAADLKGRALAVFDRVAMPHAVARQWLATQRIDPLRDLRVVPWVSVSNALQALARGDVAAVVLAASQLDAFDAEATRAVRVLAEAGTMPGPMYVARPGLPAALLDTLRRAMLAFAPDTALPVTVANTRLQMPDAAALAALDAYVAPLRDELSR